MKTKLHNRILSALLAFVMFFSSLPVGTLSAEETTDPTGETMKIVETTGEIEQVSEDPTETTETTENTTETTEVSTETTENTTETTEEIPDYSHYMGYMATFSDYYYAFNLAEEASAVTDYENVPWTGAESYSIDDYIGDDGSLSDEEYNARWDAFYAMEMKVIDWFVSTEEHGALWFKVTAAAGTTLPETLQKNPWIFAYYSGMEGEAENTALYLTAPKPQETPSISDTFVDSNGVSRTVTVSGEALPEGAQVKVTDVTNQVEAGNASILDIKIQDGENSWQPAVGETVRVSLPVSGATDHADVMHILENVDQIHYALSNNLAEIMDVSDRDAATVSLLAKGIAAYQAAFGSSETKVVAEYFQHMPIVNGCVTVTSIGFSVYILNGTTYDDVYGGYLPDYEDKTIYVTPGSVMKFTGIYDRGYDCTTDENGTIFTEINESKVEVKTEIEGTNLRSWAYWIIPNTIEVGTKFYIKHRKGVPFLNSVYYYPVEVVAQEDFTASNADVTIGIYKNDGIPAEPSNDTFSEFYYCKIGASDAVTLQNGASDKTNAITGLKNNQFPSEGNAGFVNEPVFNASGEKIINSSTGMFAIADTSGGTRLRDTYLPGLNDTLYNNIIVAYLMATAADGTLTAEAAAEAAKNYILSPYVIKYDNGWIINCKVLHNTSVTLDFVVNAPVGFNTYDLQDATAFPVSIVAQIDPNTGYAEIDIPTAWQHKLANASESVTFYGWNLEANAVPWNPNYPDDVFTNSLWYFSEAAIESGNYNAALSHYPDDILSDPDNPLSVEGYSKIRITENTTLYAIWTGKTYNTANIIFTNHVVDAAGDDVDVDTTFTFTLEDFTADYNYIIYDASKQPYDSGKTSEITNGFQLGAEWYIEIQAVENSENIRIIRGEAETGYAVEETSGTGYTVGSDGACSISINAKTNVAGELLIDFYNVLQSYTVTYVVDGETYATDTVAYGSAITLPTEPTKAGYVFAGWDEEVPAIMPAEDLTFTATWVRLYTLSTSIDNGEVRYKLETGESDLLTESVTAPSGRYQNATLTFAADKDAGYRIKHVKVTDHEGTRNYTFTNDTYSYVYTLDEGMISDIIIEVETEQDTHDVTFKWLDENGEKTQVVTVNHGDSATAPADPSRPADKDANGNIIRTWEFTGWDKDFSTVTENGLVVTAQYVSTTAQYTVTWKVDGAAYDTQTDAYGTTVKTVATPVKEGYTFSGWDKTVTTITSDVTISGTFLANTNTPYIVQHWQQNIDGGPEQNATNFTLVNTDSLTGTTDTKVTPDRKTYEGFTAPVGQEVTIAADGSTVVNYYYTRNSYTVTLNAGTGIASVSGAGTYKYGASVTINATVSTGYTWEKWMGSHDTTTKAYTFTMPANNVTNTAKATIKQYTVTVIYNDSHVTATGMDGFALVDGKWQKTMAYGDVLDLGFEAKTGYKITKAMQDSTQVGTFEGNIKCVINKNITFEIISAVQSYTITFDTDGGTAVAPITQDYGTAVTAPAAPTKMGYTFAGWDKEIPATMPAENMTIKAKWTINQYTITFDTDGGSAVAPITQDYGTAVTAPAAPTKMGYTFAGWDKEIPSTMPAENMTIKAKWTINQYTITFDTDGGSAVAPIIQDYGTTVIAPAAPTKDGYIFAGWDKEIPAIMPAENLTFTAQWRSAYEIKIVIGTGDVQQEIIVPTGSDVLIAVAPETGTTITSIMVTGKAPITADVENGYIYTATNLQSGVTITIDATSASIHYVVGAIQTGTVELTYDDTVVSSKDGINADGKHLPYEKDYVVTLTSTDGTYINTVNSNMLVTARYSEPGKMTQNHSVIATTAEGYVITFDTGDGPKVNSIPAMQGDVVTLPAPARWVDGKFEEWEYDSDGDGTADTHYASGTEFTMPAKNVTFTAQWKELGIRIGINVSYHMPNGTYKYVDLGNMTESSYHKFPDEPLNLWSEACRAYKDGNGNWVLKTDWSQSIVEQAKPSNYISAGIFYDAEYKTNYRETGYEGLRDQDVYDNIDTDGDGIKEHFSFGKDKENTAAYNGIIATWLANGKNGQYPDTDIPWNALTAENFKVVPYAIKLAEDAWIVEMVILADKKVVVTYEMNIGDGYSGADPIPQQWYGVGYSVDVAKPNNITKTVDGKTYTAKFLYWQGSDGNKYYGGSQIPINEDSQNITLTAVWAYPLVISQEGIATGETAIYQIVNSSENVVLTVALNGTESVSVYGLAEGNYTVQEISGWTWKRADPQTIPSGGAISISTNRESAIHFTYGTSDSDWLSGEMHQDIRFTAVTK